MQAAKQLRGPLVANLRGLIQSGDQLASQPPSGDPAALAQQKKQLDALTAQFKQASAGLLPLSKQGILLDLYKRTLTNWRDAVRNEYSDDDAKFRWYGWVFSSLSSPWFSLPERPGAGRSSATSTRHVADTNSCCFARS